MTSAETSPAKLAVVVLAAGEGTRMRSDHPKVLHAIAGRAMLDHVLDSIEDLAPERVVVVVGAGQQVVAERLEARQAGQPAGPDLAVAEQRERLGTGHAVLAARAALGALAEDPGATVLVVYGDTPFLRPITLKGLTEGVGGSDAASGARLLGLAFRPADPTGYGRVVLDEKGYVARIIEQADATPEEQRITLCNAGVIAARAPDLFGLLEKVGNDNAKGEYYLTDVFAIAGRDGLAARMREARAEEVIGINSRAELAVAEAVMQTDLRAAAMAGGATLVDPTTVWLSSDTRLGRDVVIHPNVVIAPGCTIGDGVEILSFSHLEGATVAAGARVGPFARLRPGARLEAGARVGNFVEVKNTTLGEGAKANHLTYLGDSEVGEGANVGAGTITCNYDGYAKHRTVIGAKAFIGSNTALVAPVTVGAGAVVGAGSTITEDVPDDALALERAGQRNIDGGGLRYRETRAEAKKKGA